nr:MAG TPA_asm: hypothetical protein [Caudoviricetes sp.]
MISGMTQAEAEKYATNNPIQLSLFYDIGRGGFAVDAVFVDQANPYNPFTGQEIPKEENRQPAFVFITSFQRWSIKLHRFSFHP